MKENKIETIEFTTKAYQKAYLHLFNEITDTIERLKKIQQETEEIIIGMEEMETE